MPIVESGEFHDLAEKYFINLKGAVMVTAEEGTAVWKNLSAFGKQHNDAEALSSECVYEGDGIFQTTITLPTADQLASDELYDAYFFDVASAFDAVYTIAQAAIDVLQANGTIDDVRGHSLIQHVEHETADFNPMKAFNPRFHTLSR